MLIKSYRLCIPLCLAALITLSCNKNTNQLPPISAKPSIIPKICTINKVGKVEAVFSQSMQASGDTIYAWLKNLTDADMYNVTVLAEICASATQDYTTCNFIKTIHADTLRSNDTAGYKLMFVNTGIKLDKPNINAGIISWNNNTHELSGTYSNYYAQFATSDTTSYLGQVRGYIFADGESIFRFRWKDSANYNATGTFVLKNEYNGQLWLKNIFQSPLLLDSVNITGTTKAPVKYDGYNLEFMFKGIKPTITDTVKTIFVHVKRDF